MAASQGLENICVAASKHTLQMTLDQVSESDGMIMGPIFMRRLFFLNLGVVDALKRLLRYAPYEYPTADNCCSPDSRRDVERAWGQAVGTLLLQSNVPATTSQALDGSLGAAITATACPTCQEVMRRRVRAVVQGWTDMKKTI